MRKKGKHVFKHIYFILCVLVFPLMMKGNMNVVQAEEALDQATVENWIGTTFTQEELAEYDAQYKLEVGASQISVINNRTYTGETLDKAVDADWKDGFWGSWDNNDASNPTALEVDFGENVEVGQLIYRVRQDNNGKGFPLKFKIQIATEENGAFTDVAEGSSYYTKDIIAIKFPAKECRKLRFVWVEVADRNPSASVFYCYKEDGREAIGTTRVENWPVASYTEEERALYNESFLLEPKSVTSNRNHYGSSVPEKATNDDWSDGHWEASINSGAFHYSEGTYLEVAFDQLEEVGHLVYRVRQDYNTRGFPLKYKIQVSTQESGDNFIDVAQGSADKTKEFIKIVLDKVECRRLRLVWLEVDDTYPSASAFYCYREDNLAEELQSLFLDGAGTALAPSVTQKDIDIVREKIEQYPVPGGMSAYVELAEMLLSGKDSTDRVRKPMVLSQMGDRWDEYQRTGLTFSLSGWDLTGYYVRPGDVIDIFVEADSDGPMPRLVLAAIGRNYSWQYGYDGMVLGNGHNRITVPETMRGCQAIYFYNPALPDEQAYAPIVRLCGGEKYPVYFYNAEDSIEAAKQKEADFIKELTEYCDKVENNLDLAALGEGEPNFCEYTSDKILLSTTAKGALSTLDSEFVWNEGQYREWLEENTVTHAVVEKDENNQITGIRFAGPAAVMEAWEFKFDDMQLYCGFNITDPAHEDYRNHGKFVYRAYTDGAGAGWGQHCYSGYNAGSVDMDSPLDSGWFSSIVKSDAPLQGSWTEYHELGHLFDSRIIGVSESTNNLFGLTAQRKYKDSTRMENDNRWYNHFTNYINTGVLPSNDLLFYPGAVIIQLDGVDFIGKSIYTETDISNYGRACRYARLHEEELSYLSKNDKLVVSFSMACGVDLSSHFEFYGRKISAEAKLLLSGLPKEERPTWLVNNRTFQGGALAEAEKESAPVIEKVVVNEDTGAVSIQIGADTYTEENVQCFSIYRQKKIGDEYVGEKEWIGVTGDNLDTKDVNELYQFTDINVVPGTTYEYSVGVYDCKLMENESKATVEVAVNSDAEVPLKRLLINDGNENVSVGVGGTLKVQAVYSPVNTTIDLNSIEWWIDGYGRDEEKTGAGTDCLILEEDPDYPGDPTRKVVKGIQSGQTTLYVKLGGFTESYRIVVNGSLAVNDTEDEKYTFAFENDRNTFKVGETYNLNLFRTTCKADGTPTSEKIRVATTPDGVSWESNNEEVISVDNRGLITVNTAGTAVISFKRGEEVVAQCELLAVAEAVPVTAIKLDTTAVTMEVGENRKLIYSLEPANATITAEPSIVSADSNCVRVEKDGSITALAGGTTTVTITIDGISAQLTVQVKDYIPLRGIALSSEKITLNKAGATEDVSLIKTPIDASVLDENAVWESENENIFTVEKGTITAVGTGTAKLTVRLAGKTTTAQVVVTGADIELTGIGFRGYSLGENISLTLNKGKTHQLALTVDPMDATALELTEWSSSNEGVATVNYGYITAISEGEASITATLTQNKGKEKEKICRVSCTVNVESANVYLEGMGISKKAVRLGGEESVQLSTYYIPTNANVDANGNELAPMVWNTGDNDIATVDSTGKVTGKSTGTTLITATGNGHTVTCQVTVNDSNLVEVITLSEEKLTFKEEEAQNKQLSCTIQPASITAVPVWKSSDSSVVEVDQKGKLTVHKTGIAEITVTLGNKSASCEVTVTGEDCTLSFNSNGGTDVETQIVTGGTRATEPNDPVKEGYTLYGWYKQGETKAFDFAKDVVTEDMTLLAKWQVNPPTANKESGEVVKNTELVLSSTTADAIYYTLDGTTPTKESTRYEKPIVLSGDTTIKAIAVEEGCADSEVATFAYTIEKLRVSFDMDGGSPQMETQQVKEGQKATQPATNPTKEGYIFRGWYIVDAQGNIADNAYDFETAVYEHFTLKAKWEAKITVPKIKGYTQYTDAVLDTTKEYIIVAVDSDNKIYALYGNANGKSIGAGNCISNTHGVITAQLTNVEKKPTAIHLNTNTVISDFKNLHFTVNTNSNGKYSFKAKDGSYLSVDSNMFSDSETFFSVTVTDGTYKLRNDSANRVLSLNVAGDSQSFNSGLKTDFWGPRDVGNFKLCLLTKNDVATYEVKFETGEGATTVDSQTVDEDGTVTEPTAPTKEGYIFAGWLLDGEVYDFTTPVTGDITLTAKWQKESVPGIRVEGIPEEVTYNAGKHTFALKVYDGENLLEEGTHYTISYKNNLNAYELDNWDVYMDAVAGNETEATKKLSQKDIRNFKSKAPQVTIKMKGIYGGSKTFYFSINRVDITKNEAFIIDPLYAAFNNRKQTPTPVITWKVTGNALKLKKEFSVVDYTNGDEFKNVDSYTLHIHGEGNFKGEAEVEFTIGNTVALSKVSVSYKKTLNWHEGLKESLEEELKVVLKYQGTELKPDEDYEVIYEKSTPVGTGSFVIKGLTQENPEKVSYTGTRRFTYKIKGTSMSKVKTTRLEKNLHYTGEEIKLLDYVDVYYGKPENTLCESEQFTVEYKKNRNKGTATMVLTGNPEEGYTGVKKINYKINAATLKNEDFGISLAGDEVDVTTYVYGGATPKVEITSKETGKELVEGVDYILSYKNNKKLAEWETAGNKAPEVTARGKGNYAGKLSMKFSIEPKDVELMEVPVRISVKDKIYKDARKNWKQSFKVLDENGKAISSREYDFKYTLVDEDTEIAANANLDKNTTVQITVIFKEIDSKGNTGNYKGTITGTYRLIEKPYDISQATIKIKNQQYTGNYIEINDENQFDQLKFAIGNDENVLKFGENIVVVEGSYKKNLNKGTAQVTFRGVEVKSGNGEVISLGGEKTVKFKIVSRDINENWWEKLLQ